MLLHWRCRVAKRLTDRSLIVRWQTGLFPSIYPNTYTSFNSFTFCCQKVFPVYFNADEGGIYSKKGTWLDSTPTCWNTHKWTWYRDESSNLFWVAAFMKGPSSTSLCIMYINNRIDQWNGGSSFRHGSSLHRCLSSLALAVSPRGKNLHDRQLWNQSLAEFQIARGI